MSFSWRRNALMIFYIQSTNFLSQFGRQLAHIYDTQESVDFMQYILLVFYLGVHLSML
jgi:hypothetical protein